MRQHPVIVFEPQCVGFEHARFNAALLQMVLQAFPDARVLFLAEQRHIAWVWSCLEDSMSIDGERLSAQPIDVPARELHDVRRIPGEVTNLCKVYRLAQREAAQTVLLSSATNVTILALLLLTWLGIRRGMPTVVVLHSVLNTLVERLPRRPWNTLLSLRMLFRLPMPACMCYVVLGDAILEEVRRIRPALTKHFRAIEYPVQWLNEDLSWAKPDKLASVPIFTFLGTTMAKGFDVFCECALAARDIGLDAEFWLAGFVNSAPLPPGADLVQGLGSNPLSDDEYARRIQSSDYVVSPGDPKHYRLTASGTFMDAVSFEKPGIYLRNPFVAHHFEVYGDLGYLCDTTQEVGDTILSLCRGIPEERYRQQRLNLAHCRSLSAPCVLAPRLRDIINEIRGCR